MKIFCFIALLHVVSSRLIKSNNITGTWTFIEAYSNDKVYIDSVKNFDNCMKMHLSKSIGKCKCFKRYLPVFQMAVTIQEEYITKDVAMYFLKSYTDMRFDSGDCQCKRDFYWARLINTNYLAIYHNASISDKSLLPSVALLAKDVPMMPKEIEEIEASNEEMYNRSYIILCSMISRQFYFN